jgi:hypothetical protein
MAEAGVPLTEIGQVRWRSQWGMDVVNLDAMLARFAEHWSPKKIAQANDYDVRIVKVQGEFTWHRHTDTDEFFLVLHGQLTIQMRGRDVVLGPGGALRRAARRRALSPRRHRNLAAPVRAGQRREHRRCRRGANRQGHAAVKAVTDAGARGGRCPAAPRRAFR